MNVIHINKCTKEYTQVINVHVDSNERGPQGVKGDTGAQGVGIDSMSINNGRLIVYLTNGQAVNAGELPKIEPGFYTWESDGVTTQFVINPAIDPRSASYILLNGLVYTDNFSISGLGDTLTLEFTDGIPTGKLQLVINGGKIANE